jgi:nucleoside-diphosphate-sugar epimerase
MRILIVGGTGNISWRVSSAAVQAGWQVTILNRGGRDRLRRAAPAGCEVLLADINNSAATTELLGARTFDAVVDFLCFGSAHAERAVRYFTGRTARYCFVSSTALYDRQVASLPLSEASPVITSGWNYAVGKAQAEQVFLKAHDASGFPVVILRAGHTYDTIIPEAVGESDWTNPWRILNGKPLVVHGDGTTLWTLTHSLDFASAIIELLKSDVTPGEVLQITADGCYTWREIAEQLFRAVGRSAPICYRTTEEIARVSSRLGSGIIGHKMWCDIYDNRKFRALCPAWRAVVPLELGMRQAIQFFQSDPRLQVPNDSLNAALDAICGLR